jgi:DNA (cytosine-5)-methyltransferase 1
LPNALRPNCHRDGHTYPSVYGRLHWDRQSPTITTGFMSPGRGRYIHPSEQRVITAHEAARIQGYPDTFQFSANGTPPSKKQLSKWIGDAVPAWLGYVAVMTALSSE